jgi:hypothetical protein
MSTASIESPARSVPARDRVAWPRLIWVAPLTMLAALAVNFLIRLVVQSLNPRLARMPQLEQPMITLTMMGCLAAIVVFVLVGLLVRDRPFFWFRVIAIGALLVSWLPDIALAIGGAPAGTAMRVVGPLATFGSPPPRGPGGGGPPGGGPGGGPAGGGPGGPGGGPPGGFSFTMPIEQVLVLMLLHLATAVVCIALLSTLMRDRSPSANTAS